MADTKVFVEYCNLPIKLVFKNEQLLHEIEKILKIHTCNVNLSRYQNRTFRQLVCLDLECNLLPEIYEKIYKAMEIQDKKNPYPLVQLYPFLIKENWILDMKDVSYMKVDLRYGKEFLFHIKRIERRKTWVNFYSYEEEKNETKIIDRENIFSVELCNESDKNEMLGMVKDILFCGTLDLKKFEFIRRVY